MVTANSPQERSTPLIARFIVLFIKGLLGFFACVVGFWAYDTYLKKAVGDTHGEANPNIAVAPEHYGAVGVFLLAVGILVAIGYAFGELGSDRADRKGYERHFGFLLCFYFTAFGIWALKRLSPNTTELERRAAEENEKKSGETPAQPLVWNLYYPRLRPHFPGIIALLLAATGATYALQIRGEDLGGRSASIKSIPMVKETWICRDEQTFTEDKNTLIRQLAVKDGKIQADAAGMPLYEERVMSGIQSEQMKSIGADDYILRSYVNLKTGNVVQLYLVYRRYGRREFNHNPDMCFPAGGYILKSREVSELPYGGRLVPVVHMTFDGSKVERGPGQMGVPETTVSYFFASGKKTEHQFLKQQLWMAVERLLPNKNGWALLRLTTDHVRGLTKGPENISANEAFSAQQDFMQTFGSEIEKSITTDDTPDAPLVNADGTPVTQ